MTDIEQKAAAATFVDRWKDCKGYEKGQTQKFWIDLVESVYGVEIEKMSTFLEFEDRVYKFQEGTTDFMDVWVPSTKVLIEQKSKDVDLGKPRKQSDGSLKTPYEQALAYAQARKYSERPRWIIICNFEKFEIYDQDKPENQEFPVEILLEDLPTEYYRMQFIVDIHSSSPGPQTDVTELSVKAGEMVARLYDAFDKEFTKQITEKKLNISKERKERSLNVFCVRLVFCLYAEGSGVFGRKLIFHDYLESYQTDSMRAALKHLFKVLNTREENRDPMDAVDNKLLPAFPYVDGGLFSDEDEGEESLIPSFTEETRKLLLDEASAGVNWAGISPTIFGAVFESTLNPETRHSGGMHYTSIENIHKVIDPLFLNDLKNELDEICAIKTINKKVHALREFQDKLASLCFLDPACGSGNFLTETYLSLRRLENKAVEEILRSQNKDWNDKKSQIVYAEEGYTIKVSLDQFYGIEINDFAVKVAKTALWIAEAQMKNEAENSLFIPLEFFPLKSNTNIIEGNAVLMNWEDVVPRSKLTYIISNPPFIGSKKQSDGQRKERNAIFSGWKNTGDLDYVSCWFKKAADLMLDSGIRTAFVATNSIVQGESVAALWKPLFEQGFHIDFAYRTFKWANEAKTQAQVYCVIIGFSKEDSMAAKVIYDVDGAYHVDHINAYLMNEADYFVTARNKALCDVPAMRIGNKPIDEGNYLFSKEEMDEFIAKEPKSAKYFRPWCGAKEYVTGTTRFCLWLGDCSPAELSKMPNCKKRVEAVKAYRLKSLDKGTRKLAMKPTRFHVETFPASRYMVIPSATTSCRKYIPMGFLDSNVISSNLNLVIDGATIYHFGILTSSVHMAWSSVVCGRLGDGYRYSKTIIYNNFPWPDPTPQQREKIEQTAQAILDVRNRYPDTSLAVLYGDLMPADLLETHEKNDRAVMQAYGFTKDMTDDMIAVELLKMNQTLVNEADAARKKKTKGARKSQKRSKNAKTIS
ncbi:MAG: methylase [Clostridia bacterium]|nr:methylase [Clostridia bacterium]